MTAAAGYDYVIAVAGMDQSASSGTTGVEDRDRTAITLPGQQGQLIAQLAAANPNTVAYMETIGPQDVTSFEPTTSAILWSSYNGMRKGESLADVLLGAYNPSGRTNGIWYQTNAQIPSVTDYTIRPVGPTGRTYMYYNGPLQYPFGYGLSYSTFAYSNLQVDNHTPAADDTVTVSADVTNTSSSDGNEIVELYASTPNADASLERPLKRLEGFQKVFLAAGQTKTVTFPLKIADLAFFSNADGRWEVDNGAYGIQISTSSADADIRLQDTITVGGSITPKPSVLTARPRIAATDDVRGIAQRVLFPENVDVDAGPDGGDERRHAVRLDRARREPAVPGRDDVQLLEQPPGGRLGRAAARSTPCRTAPRRSRPRPPTTARARRRRSSSASSPTSARSRTTGRRCPGSSPTSSTTT